jgi:hypothetical protein
MGKKEIISAYILYPIKDKQHTDLIMASLPGIMIDLIEVIANALTNYRSKFPDTVHNQISRQFDDPALPQITPGYRCKHKRR